MDLAIKDRTNDFLDKVAVVNHVFYLEIVSMYNIIEKNNCVEKGRELILFYAVIISLQSYDIS